MDIDFFRRLESYAASRPDAVALQSISVEERAVLTYSQFVHQVRDLGRFLEKSGLAPSDHVAIFMEERLRWGVAFVGAYSAGLAIVPLDPTQEPGTLAAALEHADCRLAITSHKYVSKAREILKQNGCVKYLFDGDSEGLGYEWDRDVEVCSDSNVSLPFVSNDAQCDMAILYTSGTTGVPKGVRITQANIFWTIWDMLEVCPVTSDDHILSILPLFHIMSLLANLLGPLYVGAQVTYLHYRDPARIIGAFKEENITGFLCVPQFFYLLRRRIFEEAQGQNAAKRFLFFRLLALSQVLRRRFGWNAGKLFFGPLHSRLGPRFRLFGVGGASFEPVVAETFLSLGFSLFHSYGMTETTGPAAITPADAYGGLSCGPPMPHVEITIDNPDESGIGEILIRGEHVTKGYWKDPAATVDLVRSGWLWSGDLGYIDSSGRVHVTGRKKEVIVLSSGKNVYPEDVEFHLQNGSAILKEVCVVAAPGDSAGERLHAIVVPDFDLLKGAKVANIHDRVRYDIENLSRRLPSYQRLHSFEIRTAPLPRTATRKLKRFEISASEFTFPPKIVEGTTDARDADVFQLIRQVKANCGAIDRTMNLELDLDFDSLERVELFANIRSQFGLEISDEEATRIFTVGELATLLESRRSVESANWLRWREILRKPLSPDQARMAAQCFWRSPVIEAVGFLLSRIFGIFGRRLLPLRVSNPEKIPNNYPFIICANHASYIDAFVIASSLPFPVFRRLFFFGSSNYARSRFQRLIWRATRTVRIDPNVNLHDALRLGAEGLSRGLVLCVFPEGHRSIDGFVQDFRKGPSILAKEVDAPVLPISISGSHDVWGRASSRIRLRPVEIRFGSKLEPFSGETYAELTERICRAVLDGVRSP